jgi:copper chaperone CopZ
MRVHALPLIAVVALSGCGQVSSGTGNFTGDAKVVAQAVSDLSSDGSRSKPDDICAKLLSAKLRQAVTLGGAGCASEIKKAIEDADTFGMKVQDVKVAGATATARVKSTERSKDVFRTLSFVRESGGWKIDSFG